jgi:hypothetical protein
MPEYGELFTIVRFLTQERTLVWYTVISRSTKLFRKCRIDCGVSINSSPEAGLIYQKFKSR